jgi:hypothetical protein
VTTLLPDGFVTLREAAEIVAQGRYAGVPDSELVAELRHSGLDVADGTALDDAIAEIPRPTALAVLPENTSTAVHQYTS